MREDYHLVTGSFIHSRDFLNGKLVRFTYIIPTNYAEKDDRLGRVFFIEERHHIEDFSGTPGAGSCNPGEIFAHRIDVYGICEFWRHSLFVKEFSVCREKGNFLRGAYRKNIRECSYDGASLEFSRSFSFAPKSFNEFECVQRVDRDSVFIGGV